MTHPTLSIQSAALSLQRIDHSMQVGCHILDINAVVLNQICARSALRAS
jgi:hypothetical protein